MHPLCHSAAFFWMEKQRAERAGFVNPNDISLSKNGGEHQNGTCSRNMMMKHDKTLNPNDVAGTLSSCIIYPSGRNMDPSPTVSLSLSTDTCIVCRLKFWIDLHRFRKRAEVINSGSVKAI